MFQLRIFHVFTVDFSVYMHWFFIIFPWQNGLDTKVEKSRKQMKERKNRAKKIRGVKKVSWFLKIVWCFLDGNPLLTYLFLPFVLQTKASDAAKAKKKWVFRDLYRPDLQQWTLFNSSIFLLGFLKMKSFVVSIGFGVFWCFVILSDFEYYAEDDFEIFGKTFPEMFHWWAVNKANDN